MSKGLGRKNWVKGCKERGEWAELCFMAKAAGMGLSVSKPYGESRRYDVLVEAGGRIMRVQVKSTLYRRRGKEYSLNVMGPGRKGYKKGTVDFFAVYLIPEDSWYIIPYGVLGKKLTLHFCPGGGRQKYANYREAWHLLGCERERLTIQACAEEESSRLLALAPEQEDRDDRGARTWWVLYRQMFRSEHFWPRRSHSRLIDPTAIFLAG